MPDQPSLPPFAVIFDRAAERKGGPAALKALLPAIASKSELRATPDDRYLAAITRAVFNAGMNWTIVGRKWDGFETVFKGFDPALVLAMPVEEWEAAQTDTRIIRHATKIATVAHNAQFVTDIAAEHGSFGAWLANYDPSRQIDLLADLKKRGARLGGTSAQYFLRRMGYDGFVYTQDVMRVLLSVGVGNGKPPTSKKAATLIQDAFNQWQQESGYGYAALSRIIACSTGDNVMHAGQTPDTRIDEDGDVIIQLDEHPL